VGEPDEMIPGAIVSGFQMTDGITRRGDERPRRDHADARRLSEQRLAVLGGAEHAIPRCLKGGLARAETRGGGHVRLLLRGILMSGWPPRWAWALFVPKPEVWPRSSALRLGAPASPGAHPARFAHLGPRRARVRAPRLCS